MTTPTASEEVTIDAERKGLTLVTDPVTKRKRWTRMVPDECREYWIVTDHPFAQHATLEGAEKERSRLLEKFPTKRFRVLRVKKRLQASTSAEDIASLRASLERMEAVVEAAREAASHTYPDMDDHNGACLIRNLHDAIAALDAEGNGT